MNALSKILAAAVCGLLLGLPAAQAEIPVYVFINVGTVGDELTVFPGELTLKEGTVYKFVVSNPSDTTHIVAAPELAATVKTTELTIGSPRLDWPTPGISEGISLPAGQMIEWTFTPTKEGRYKFGCDDPVHAAAGMHAMINIVEAL